MAGRCGLMTNFIHVLNMRRMFKIDRRGEAGVGVWSKNRSLGNYSKLNSVAGTRISKLKSLITFLFKGLLGSAKMF